MDEKRMAGDYEITNSIHIGDKEIVLGVDMNNTDGDFYMVADYNSNELFGMYDNAFVGNDFLEIAEEYSNRLKEQIDKTKAEVKDFSEGIVTSNMCDSIRDKDLNNEIIVIKADVLRPEYRTQLHQIVRCTGGNGARANARGSAVYCSYLSNGKHTRFERYDVLGILKKEHYPKWLTEKLGFEQSSKESSADLQKKVKKHKDMER